jgi:FixJ family two-component response regulator
MIAKPVLSKGHPRLTLIDADSSLRRTIKSWIQSHEGELICCGTREEFLHSNSPADAECVLTKAAYDKTDLQVIGKHSPHVGIPPIIFIVGVQDAEYGIYLLKHGAADVLTVRCNFFRLTQAITQGWERCAQLKARMAESALCRKRIKTLTTREHEVLSFLLKGLLNKQVAAELNICENTVKAHRKRIMSKTGVRSLVKLARWVERTQALSDLTGSAARDLCLNPVYEAFQNSSLSNGELRAA